MSCGVCPDNQYCLPSIDATVPACRYLSEADGVDGSSYCYRPSGCRSGYCDLKFQLVGKAGYSRAGICYTPPAEFQLSSPVAAILGAVGGFFALCIVIGIASYIYWVRTKKRNPATPPPVFVNTGSTEEENHRKISIVSPSHTAGRLRELKSLLDEGVLTKEEFEDQKKLILADPNENFASSQGLPLLSEETVNA
mmetsp:Transcript_2248/g.3036  ORF Transcript_2248/g.3036 Transcript_2248/m.3036 type:complete len:195 (-) Transcript_2248:146-730(-)|eukprot:CAMPEP_0175094494 /NCGR_PEP_ID=MMETSP0086_2-20121207/3623_1 /TAXON_ID=136419 /ORGANISM="Unknown Unknown, Strain D1" /LENGTH=194 /DNA_ID=CAMNT_0016367621 /DNA_START=22 /DNA_END=606 /DNA_ORIENTATION=+